METDNKNSIPLPLVIICLIIIFFVGLIYSYYYFQTRLQQINFINEDIVNSVDKPLKIVIFGIVSPQPSQRYLRELTLSISDELKCKALIKILSQNEDLNYLDSGQVDVVVTSNKDQEQNYQKYNYSDDIVNTDQLLFTKKSNIQLQTDLDYALSSLLIKGIATDLKQKFLN